MLENHWDGILAYFDEGRSSGPVEGLNTKMRVITRRSYGISSVTTLWTRVLLDVNWAAKKVGQTIADIRQLAGAFRPILPGATPSKEPNISATALASAVSGAGRGPSWASIPCSQVA